MSLYQLFGVLDPATEAALVASIQRFGVLVPVVKDQHGNVLDGHHRARIADDLGVDYRVDRMVVRDADEAAEIAQTLNTDRRHLSVEQRREVAKHLYESGHSKRAIGNAIGVSDVQVGRDLDQLRRMSQLESPERTVGLDGKSRPAQRASPRIVPPIVTKAGKIKLPAAERAEQIRELAGEGHLATQIAERIGVSEQRVRGLARSHEITLPDATIRGRRIDPTRVIGETISALEGLALGLELLGGDALPIDTVRAESWATSLSHSLRPMNRLLKRLREMNQ